MKSTFLAGFYFAYTKLPALFNSYPLKKTECLQNWWPVFKRTYKIFLNEKSFQQYLILAIFLCHFLELIGQPGQTLLKFKGSDGKSNGFVLLWMLNVAIFMCYSIICSHMPLKMYRSFRPKWGSRLQKWWCFWLILIELCCPNYLHTISYQDTFYEVTWKN